MSQLSGLTLLSSAILLVSTGIHAEVISVDTDSRYQRSESISAVIYHSQESVAEISQMTRVVKPISVKPLATTAVMSPPPVAELVVPPLSVSPKMRNAPLVVLPSEPVAAKVKAKSPVVLVQKSVVEEVPSFMVELRSWFAIKPVKPWQKGTLAKKAMKPGGLVPEFDVFSEKVFAYKQGSIGGNGIGGGGCGCN